MLGTVFLRFCEDNELIELPYLAGPGERMAIAAERQQAFFERNPAKTDRDWIVAGIQGLADASPVAAGLFDRSTTRCGGSPRRTTPRRRCSRSGAPGARARTRRSSTTSPTRTGTPASSATSTRTCPSTRKKTYALLQTPEFVEEFILDLTLTPAIDEFGLEPEPPRARPTCRTASG